MESQLRKNCQTLLKQLQISQQQLNSKVAAHEKLDGTTSKSVNYLENDDTLFLKSTYARNKLLNATKPILNDDCKVNVTTSTQSDFVKNKENIYERNMDNLIQVNSSRQIHHHLPSQFNDSEGLKPDATQSKSYKNYLTSAIDHDAVTSSSWQPATPNTQRRRNLIDRHIHVPTRLDAAELRDLNNERRLNFSYSHIHPDNDDDDNDIPDPSSESNHLSETHDNLGNQAKTQTIINKMNPQSFSSVTKISCADGEHDGKDNAVMTQTKIGDEHQRGNSNFIIQTFKEHLEDDGNKRKLNSFIRDTTIKPKSLLNSSSYSLHHPNLSHKSTSGVRFETSGNSSEPCPDQRLLGYDWIAALLDNSSELVDQSESFFNELREFRRAYKDECSNQFYMHGPHTLVDFEPEPVAEALREPKVEPYIVNERLFTVPLQRGLIDYQDEGSRVRLHTESKRDPTDENPRFVRVSIPRSTLQSPHRIKPHRRRSFDASDSCSLMDHCLLGWENALPSMIPTAKSVDLNTAAGTRKDYQTTTLTEAEKLASAYSHSQWPFGKPNPRLELLALWKKHYMDTANNMSLPRATSVDSSISRATGGESIKRTTDKLLNSTYANMYEMERLKEQRRLERKMKTEEKTKCV